VIGEQRGDEVDPEHVSNLSDSPREAKPKYGDGIEWKLKQDVDFLRDA